MYKKVYFIISAVIIILFSFLSITTAKTQVNNEIKNIDESYMNYNEEYRTKIKEILEDKGVTIYRTFGIVGVVANLYLLILITKDSILKKKGTFIGTYIFNILFIGNTLVLLLSLTNLITILSTKRKSKEDYPEKKEIPLLKHEKSNRKEILLAVMLILIYASQFLLKYILPSKLNYYLLGTSIFYIIVFIASIIIFKDDLKKGIKLFLNNKSAYINYILKTYGLGLIIYFCITSLVTTITGGINSVNQESLESLPNWFIIPASVIWAPIVEEIIFRGVLRRFINNNILFIITSALIFGFLHATHEVTLLNKVMWTLPYASLGAVFAYIYVKTDNITNNIILHAIHNSIGAVISFM